MADIDCNMIEWSKTTICVAGKDKYSMIKATTGKVDEEVPKFQTSLLLDQEFLHFAPLIKILGVIGATHGVQQPEAVINRHSSSKWHSLVRSITFSTYPFIVGVTKDNVEVANLYDSKVDSIKFADGEFAFECKGKIYIASKRSILVCEFAFQWEIVNNNC